MKLHAALWIALLSSGADARQATSLPSQAPATATPLGFVSVFEGMPGGFGDVRVFEEHFGTPVASPAALSDLRLLPIDFVGRTQVQELLPDRPRLRRDVPGAARLELPGGMGSLYHYERRVANGSVFGYLRIGRSGRPLALAERPGLGPAGDQDPFLDRIAIARDGRALLAATLPMAGGDLIEANLRTGAVFDRTANLPAQDFSDAGLWLGDDWGFGVAGTGVQRFDRGAGAVVERVPFPSSPAVALYSGEAVMSRNREWALTTAGADTTHLHAWVFGRTGEARCASDADGALSGAGFLPESVTGPYLAVSDDGQNAAWRREGSTREVFLTRVEATPSVDVQVSANMYFDDTVDEVAELMFLQLDVLMMTMGELDIPTGEIEKIDVFDVRLDVNANPTFTNRTLSSNQTSPPFLGTATIKPDRVHLLPGTDALVIHDSEDDELLGVAAGQVGTQVLLTDVKEVFFVEPTPGFGFMSLRRESGNKPTQLFRVPIGLGAPATMLHPGSDITDHFFPVSRGDGWVGYLLRIANTQDFMMRVDVANATFETLQPAPSAFAPPIGFTSSGAQVFTQGPATGPNVTMVWPVGRPAVVLQAPVGPGFVLN